MPVLKRIELICTGEELLIGLTANCHLSHVGGELSVRGLALARSVVVSDDPKEIGDQFRESWARADLVITTGGLGPTCDDRTREVVAEVLGQRLVQDEEAAKAIRDRLSMVKQRVTENNHRQAFRPESGVCLPNPNGTAPGIWVEQDGRILVMLPGPVSELVPMFRDEVLPRLEARGFFPDRRRYIQIRTAGIGESALETRLQPIIEERPGVEVAFCAHSGQVDVRLSSRNGVMTPERLQIIANRCRESLGFDFVCFGGDSLVKVVSDMLRHGGHTLAVAESCTGGLLANCFTDISGASKFFAGGVTCYNNDCKVQLLGVPECLLAQHGAVSAETAVAMATGAAELLETSHGLSTTGFAGPCGGTTASPVGTIYLGLHTPHGVWSRRVSYPGSRQAVKQRAVNAAIDWLRRELIRSALAQKDVPAGKPVSESGRAEGQNLFGLSGA